MSDVDLDEQTEEVLNELMREVSVKQRVAMQRDDNPEVLRLITNRMILGAERYGHGLRAFDDTRQWGTDIDSWTVMALEEVLDMTIYLAAEIVRINRHRNALFTERGVTPPQTQSSGTQSGTERNKE